MNAHFAIISEKLVDYYEYCNFLSDTQNSLQGYQGCREHTDVNPEAHAFKKVNKNVCLQIGIA